MKCRCHRDYNETNIFYLFQHTNDLITLEWKEVFDYVFNWLKNYNAEESVKEILLQVLVVNANY